MDEIKVLESNLNDENVIILEQKRQELFQLRQKKVDGLIVRSRAKWIADGEKNSKYFCSLEKRNFVKKAMCFIEKDNGELLCDSDEITKEVKSFYAQLYASREHNITNEDIPNNLEHPVLTEEERNGLEGIICDPPPRNESHVTFA